MRPKAHEAPSSVISPVGRNATFPKGEGFWLGSFRLFSLPPRGRGTARNERWMRDASDKLMLPNFVTLLLQRAYLLGYISQEVRRRSRSDPDHPVNGREGEERAAYVRPVSYSSLRYRGAACREKHKLSKRNAFLDKQNQRFCVARICSPVRAS